MSNGCKLVVGIEGSILAPVGKPVTGRGQGVELGTSGEGRGVLEHFLHLLTDYLVQLSH